LTASSRGEHCTDVSAFAQTRTRIALKKSLVRSVDCGQWQRMRDLLTTQASTGPGDERELTSGVLAIWLLGV
jgi:hypothetical protein